MNTSNKSKNTSTSHKIIISFVVLILLVGAIFVIAKVVSAPTKETSSSVKLKGEMVCLPHKDNDGPHTLECAYGFKAEDGTYYALKEKDPDHPIFADKELKKAVTIEGTLEPEESDIYEQKGIITVDKVAE